MKTITLSRDTFLSAASKALLYVSKKPIIPILACFRLHFDGSKLSVIASMGDSSQATAWCEGKGEPFSACVDAFMLHDIISAMIEPTVTLKIGETRNKNTLTHLSIESKGMIHKLPIFDPLEFNIFKEPEPKNKIVLRGSIFVGMINNAKALVEDKRNETMPHLNGIYMSLHKDYPGALLMQGGTGLSFTVVEYSGCGVGEWDAVIIDKQAVKNIEEMIEGHQDVTVCHDKVRLSITTGTLHIVTRLLEGKFPGMAEMLKKIKTTGNIRFSAAEMGAAVRRLQFHKTDSQNTMALSIAESIATATLDNIEQATIGDEEIAVSGNPEPIRIGFNIDVYDKALRSCNAISIEQGYSEPTKPIVLTPVDADDNRYRTHVVVGPVKLERT